MQAAIQAAEISNNIYNATHTQMNTFYSLSSISNKWMLPRSAEQHQQKLNASLRLQLLFILYSIHNTGY